ncbi:DUF4365 domain-containing protein [Clavibacter tessellarius]|uniref:DUF4365 domain-containing protein n=1 Tax=Clavibacter tessellarius TaxID=31965 RepID=UPI0039BF95D9
MPRRPASHVNEERSLRAFLGALPPDWLFTTPSRDYGIDGDIEVFENGRATGMHFLVQLKAVAEVRGAPRVSVRNASRRYWAEHERADSPGALGCGDFAHVVDLGSSHR